jgi:hypothetical protein
MDDLSGFAPVPETLTVGGRHFAILPLRMRQWSPVLTALGEALPALLAMDLRRVLVGHEARLSAALAAATGAEADWLSDLYPADFVRLLEAVVRVNRDFFDHATQPALVALFRAFVPRTALTDGAASSPAASPADSGWTTSST